ncbi:hypothetical protein RJ639_030702 [Escallonia herrerae]|uniref:RING-type E3 ubiquitin transferase n=1 Tax=Escallonia herrerae TaxID=1293975 RepID=A0AA89BE61_9ASTE|nr:hypothetical protein RJ639_030702 [Escallonia herrerae]
MDFIAITNGSKAAVAAVTIFFVLHLFLKHFRRRQPSLPTLTFNPKKSTTSSLYCTVCLHDVAGGETYRKLPECGHCFHSDCIDDWLQSQLTCPLCRSQVCHLPRQHQQPGQRRFLNHFVALSLSVLGRVGHPRSYELILAFCESMSLSSPVQDDKRYLKASEALPWPVSEKPIKLPKPFHGQSARKKPWF